MSLFSGTFNKTAHYAPKTGIDSNTDPVLGTQDAFQCRHERNAERVRNEEGEIVDEHDVLYTHTEIDQSTMVWAPDDDETNNSEAVQPTSVESSTTLDGSTTLYKVIL